MSTPLLLGSVLLVSLIVSTVALWLGAKLVRAQRSGFGWALLAAVLFVLIHVTAVVGALYAAHKLGDQSDAVRLGVPIAVLVVQALIDCLALMLLFRTGFLRAAGVWGIHLVATTGLAALLLTVGKQSLMDAYIVPTNAMAPSIIGYHRTAACPHCGQPLVVPAPAPDDEFRDFDRMEPGICTSCRKTSRPAEVDPTVLGPERVLANKTLTPRRWDAVVFRYPPQPSLKYVKRLVGLPGEKVFVKDGAVWVNGEKLDPPARLSGLRFTDEIGGLKAQFGTEDNPVQLGADEYWMLGDFSERSSDSRFWGPVPGKNLEGVVGLRYWPLARWQLIR